MRGSVIKIFFLVGVFIFSSKCIVAQRNVPQAMKFQAAARDKFGFEIRNKKITIRFTLFSKKYSTANTIYYREAHEVITNDIGLFTLNIGEGKPEQGVFRDIPWATDDIYLDVDLQEKPGLQFVNVSSNRLLAVPYAFYAGTSAHVLGVPEGDLSNIWSQKGNWNINPETDFLGTKDKNDLNLRTDNKDRLIIKANGDIKITGPLEVGENLTVKRNVYLNTVSGVTDIEGVTTIKNPSESGEIADGALVVKGGAGIAKKLNVGGNTNIAGITHVLNEDQSNSITDGALVVNGGMGLAKKLHVGGNTYLEDSLQAAGPVAITNQTESVNITSGALVVNGGAGLSGNLNVGGTLTVDSTTFFNSDDQSYDILTGGLILKGGAGIAKNVNIGGKLNIIDSTILHNSLKVIAPEGGYIARFINNKNANGIDIRVGNPDPDGANSFVTFRNINGQVVGQIAGETLAEMRNSQGYKDAIADYDLSVALAATEVALSGIDVAIATADIIAAAASTTTCVGLGVCQTVPIPSLVASSIANGILVGTQAALAAVDLKSVTDSKNKFIASSEASVGVSYQSGHADYAEWLPKKSKDEKLRVGDLVAIKNGLVALNTEGATQLMVVSGRPIVLGNMPKKGEEGNYEKVAFLGQLPVRVTGKVSLGDFIVPNGNNDGYGKGIQPADMKPDDYEKIVGIAWSSSDNAIAGWVNVAVGLHTNSFATELQRQAGEIADLRNEINNIKTLLGKNTSITGDFKKNYERDVVHSPDPAIIQTMDSVIDKLGAVEKSESAVSLPGSRKILPDAGNKVVYYEVPMSLIEQGLKQAQKIAVSQGMDKNFVWRRINSDPAFKKIFLEKLKMKIDMAMEESKIMDSKFANNRETVNQ